MEERWDDSAIVEAFKRAVALHDGGVARRVDEARGADGGEKEQRPEARAVDGGEKEQGPDLRWRDAEKGTERETSRPAVPGLMMPGASYGFPPEQAEALSALLLAWYNAGYQMGRYEALHGNK